MNHPRQLRTLLAALAALFLTGTLHAQVPRLINYQGRIAVAGANFEGNGQFKFALVDGGVDQNVQATAFPMGAGGTVFFIGVINGGSGYTAAPAVTITDATGSGAAAVATIANGVVTNIQVTDGGSGYSPSPVVAIAPPPPNILTTSFWNNGGTNGGPADEPATAVELPVTKGLYSVLLGDITIPNMAAIAPGLGVFNRPNLRLRVWFNDGVNGFQLLTPDQRLAPAAYLADGAVTAATIADEAIIAAKIAPGTIDGTHLASGAAAANLNAAGQSGVASGGMVLSATENNAALVSAGYVKLGATTLSDAWLPRTDGTPPTNRYAHTAVWTGSEMIVWGGRNSVFNLNTGGRYNPAGNTWTAVSTTGAPTERSEHTAVWTGGEMIVWGGLGAGNSGGRYNPAADNWTSLASASGPLPAGRYQHTAVWTGNEMIVWGGYNGSSYFYDGGRYDPSSDSWAGLSVNNEPTARSLHTAVWTGTEMLVWGGKSNLIVSSKNDGGRYNPTLDSWAAIGGIGTNRNSHTAVWTGSAMLVWGGLYNDGSNHYLNDGWRYNPAGGGSWAAVSAIGAPAMRALQTAVWTGSEMIVWGGADGSTYFNDGGRYNPVGDRWTLIANTLPTTPAGRKSHTAVWTTVEMIVWGGLNASNILNDTFSFTPGRRLYLYQRP